MNITPIKHILFLERYALNNWRLKSVVYFFSLRPDPAWQDCSLQWPLWLTWIKIQKSSTCSCPYPTHLWAVADKDKWVIERKMLSTKCASNKDARMGHKENASKLDNGRKLPHNELNYHLLDCKIGVVLSWFSFFLPNCT